MKMEEQVEEKVTRGKEKVAPAVPAGAEARKRQLRELKDLFEEGLLEETEYQSAKKEILSLISAAV